MFCCAYLPDFSVQAISRLENILESQPLVVVEGSHPVLAVCSFNQAARSLGLCAGMTQAQVEQFAGVLIRRRSAALEAEVHQILLDSAWAVSPRVEDTALDTLILDISGLSHLFGSPESIAERLCRLISAANLNANIAMASNPDAAQYAARGFSGITVIAEGHEPAKLGSLPVALLNPPGEISEILDGWGSHTFRQFAALPPIPLSERLGQEGLRLQQLARGPVLRPLIPAEPPLKFEEAAELEDAIELLEPLAFVLGDLLNRICEQLIVHSLATNQLHFQLRLENGSVHERTIRFPAPMCDSSLFLKLLTLDLRSHPPQAAITKVILTADPAKPKLAQNRLFGATAPAPEKLELTLARISRIVGEGNVGSPELLDTHRPQAFRVVRFNFSSQQQKQVAKRVRDRKRAIALRIFRPNRRARVWSKHGRPQILSSGRMRSKVLTASGPWLGSGDWWEQRSWAREQWDVTLEQGLFRIYHDLVNGGWYIEGCYD